MMRNRKATGRAVAFLLQCRAAEEKSAACFFVVDALDGLVQPGMPGLCFLRLARRHLLLSCAESAVGAGKNRLTAKVDIGRPSGRMRRTGFRIRRRRDFHGPVRFSDGKTEPNELFNLAELLVLVNAAEGNCSSSASCTSGAADSMNIGFRLHGKIIVDDVRETFNIQAAGQSGAEIVLRCPVIPGINDTHDHFERIAVLSRQLSGIRQVDLLPYHSFGNGKRAQLGQAADGFYAPQEEMVEQWIGELSALCHGTVCRA